MDTLKVVKRSGEIVDFDESRIKNAIKKAVIATQRPLPDDVIEDISVGIQREIERRFTDFFPNVENIQDLVEKHLVLKGHYEIAKSYILYRAKKQLERDEKRKLTIEKSLLGKLTVTKKDGRKVLFDIRKVHRTIERAAKGFGNEISAELIAKEVLKNIYDGATTQDIEKAIILATNAFIEKDPAYSYVASKLFMQRIYKEVMAESITDDGLEMHYREAFAKGIRAGVEKNILDPRLLEFDLDKLGQYIKIGRDGLFQYMGVHTLYERYFLKTEQGRIELPQAFWMRVAMGLSIGESNKNEKAIEFYDAISEMRFVPSTPTLFHSGTNHPQLSSCYLTTVKDDLKHIFKCVGDNAQLSKWSGGLGNDWTNIRATGSWIKSTNVESQGVIPFLKIANDVTAAINRSGKRRGATCAYLETWHLDIEDFLELRKNTGDERRRTHDMNTANWVPDLFMKRVMNDETWTLFSPEEVPELHNSYGSAFEKKYIEYEEKVRNGKIRKHKVVSAQKMWRKMLSMLFETGHPWITFKDPCNVRSPQDHMGVVHSSNLCTEITLNTSEDETAVCNLGSINLPKHITNGELDRPLLANTVKTAMRMLDNVIDINYYPTIEAENSNLRHRPVGLGVMGFQDALYLLDLSFDSQNAIKFADNSMEFISYYAILSSSELAKERGTYDSYKGSKWERGIFPLDTVGLLEVERGMEIDVNKDSAMDWAPVKEHVKQHGMRNSNTMAIAPTATISTIAGCFPSIEPIYKNIYVKANMSGEFTVVNPYLIQDLKKLSLWNQEMLERLKYYDGSIQLIPEIPKALKGKYKEAFEVDPVTAIKQTSVRAKWIDQSQSHNVFMKGVSGNKLNDIYIAAWKTGLKTTYYLRSLAATQIEKSTLDASKYGFTQTREYEAESAPKISETPVAAAHAVQMQKSMQQMRQSEVVETIGGAKTVATEEIKLAEENGEIKTGGPKVCLIDDPDCEACQ